MKLKMPFINPKAEARARIQQFFAASSLFTKGKLGILLMLITLIIENNPCQQQSDPSGTGRFCFGVCSGT